ncbi:MAG: ATP-binding protein [Armatimonadetes bacterium]|nr:ATP-binding protein [Armatimonadota bacterium]HOC30672.1 ATP-binding protein [Armatimonadota bacterium]
MCQNDDRRVFQADADSLPAVLTFVLEAAEKAGVPLSRLPHLELAVDETLTNIIRYAYRGDFGKVEVRVTADDRDYMVEFADRGAAFNPLSAPPPDLSTDLANRKPGGLGIFFTRQMVDDVEYRRDEDRNVLTLVMRLP